MLSSTIRRPNKTQIHRFTWEVKFTDRLRFVSTATTVESQMNVMDEAKGRRTNTRGTRRIRVSNHHLVNIPTHRLQVMYADGRQEYDFGVAVSGTQFNARLMGVVQSGEKDALRQCAVTEPLRAGTTTCRDRVSLVKWNEGGLLYPKNSSKVPDAETSERSYRDMMATMTKVCQCESRRVLIEWMSTKYSKACWWRFSQVCVRLKYWKSLIVSVGIDF